jgi:hypothetical protein
MTLSPKWIPVVVIFLDTSHCSGCCLGDLADAGEPLLDVARDGPRVPLRLSWVDIDAASDRARWIAERSSLRFCRESSDLPKLMACSEPCHRHIVGLACE